MTWMNLASEGLQLAYKVYPYVHGLLIKEGSGGFSEKVGHFVIGSLVLSATLWCVGLGRAVDPAQESFKAEIQTYLESLNAVSRKFTSQVGL